MFLLKLSCDYINCNYPSVCSCILTRTAAEDVFCTLCTNSQTHLPLLPRCRKHPHVMKSWSSLCPWAEIEDLSTPQCAWTYCRSNLRQLSRRMSLRRSFVFTQVSGWSLHQIPLGHSQEPAKDYVWALALIGNAFISLFRDITVPLSPSTVLQNTLTMTTTWQVLLIL